MRTAQRLRHKNAGTIPPLVPFSRLASLDFAIDTRQGGVGVSGGLVNTWGDTEKSFTFITSSNTSLKPVWSPTGINNVPGVYTDGVGQYMTMTYPRPQAPGAVLVVVTPMTNAAPRGVIAWQTGVNNSSPWLLLRREDANTFRWYFNGSYRITINHPDDVPVVLGLAWDNTVKWYSYINGVAGPTSTTAYGTNTASALYIGNGAGGYFHGMFGHLQVHTAYVTPANMTMLSTQLMQRFGIS